MNQIGRSLEPLVDELLDGFRAIVVTGPRQSGKSTLVKRVQDRRGAGIVSLDDPGQLELAVDDPNGFIDGLAAGTAIDEFQRGGDPLLLAIKSRLDRADAPGELLLTGSTRFLAGSDVADTLTGRVGVLQLYPLSQSELAKESEFSLVDALFDGLEIAVRPTDRVALAKAIATGGFPELALGPESQRFHTTWFESYITTVTDAMNTEQVGEVRRPIVLRSLLTQLASRSGQPLVIADLAKELGVDGDTVRRYLDVLNALFLSHQLPAWTTSATNRAKRRPVTHLVDSGVATHLLDLTIDDLTPLGSRWFGPLLETWVVNELQKHATWARRPVRLHHYRDRDQREVDIVIERGRQVIGVKVKATATPRRRDATHLEYLRDRVGERFHRGILLHAAGHRVQLGDRIDALPLGTLFRA